MTEALGCLGSGPICQPRCQTLRFSVLQTRAGPGRIKGTFLDSSETGRAPIGSSIGLCLTRRTGSRRQGSHVWISQSRPSCTAFSGHRLMCATAFLVMEAGRKKRRASFSHCWRTLSTSQTWPSACSATSWLYTRQRWDLIWQRRPERGWCPLTWRLIQGEQFPTTTSSGRHQTWISGWTMT